MNDFKRKIALVTGGAIRVGALISKSLANKGWKVIIHYNKSSSEAEMILKDQPNIVGIEQCDFTNQYQTKIFLSEIIKKYGHINLLVNSASIFENDNLDEIDIEKWQCNFSVNLLSPALLISEFAKQDCFNEQNRGNIINICDQDADDFYGNFISYKLSKLSLAKLTKFAATKYAPFIRVNAISLGVILKTEKQSVENFDRLVEKSLLRKIISNNDLEATINYILENNSMSGQILSFTGKIND